MCYFFGPVKTKMFTPLIKNTETFLCFFIYFKAHFKALNVVLKASGNLHISVWRQPFFSFCYCFLSCTQLGTVSTSQQVIKVRERSCLLYTREVQKHNSFSISLLEEVLPINIIHTSKQSRCR